MAYTGREPSERVREVWDTVVRARDVGLESIRARAAAGETILGWQVDRVVRDYIHDRGFGEYFVHRTGHNIGANADHGDGTHLDDLETQDARPLVVDTCFSIEPGVYLPGEFGVRSEINVFFARTGPQVYTPAQTRLRLLG
jgi:Xaa-Pro aminopeptidase